MAENDGETIVPDEQCNLTASTPMKSSGLEQVESPKERKTSMVECDDEGNPSSGTPDESPKQLTPHSIPPRRRRSPRRPEVSASRLPLKVLNQIFQYLPLKDLRSAMLTCHSWNNALSMEDSDIWQYLLGKKLPEAAVSDPFLLAELGSAKKKLRAWYFAWNTSDISRNNYIRTNGFTVHRQPVAQSTDGVRGKRGISKGVHAFDITWDGPLGTVAVVGIATKHAALHCVGYVALLGSDDQSWGWNLVDNVLMHNGAQLGVYPKMNNPPKYEVGDKIRLIIDCDTHVAYFERNSEFLGIAFNHIPPLRLYPAVCAVYGNTEVTMVYVGSPQMG
ncbi:F-box/SPRY domain-containing protein 1 [Caenorhabditis elegans]|uniref:F-box/SPRY domain-containing protein 1 n=1 Tax=Caenorhabditis elegans TaxID=6239 RepID=FBSP1_CAEEL|nr:F-box/SPRY domain-containing protein 1 [Caenorhabditis elegans]Q18223.1 RecName: Full=F-box/SPRY domain-containing protein 1; AltName: Full=F-box synaptic protein 1 [Caenorhabditis elegans]CCD65729.1 F-box/SPRY domain-containing protein 1 [Caenorhabditis elegans]|eukprot:NP_498046.1 F-box/SPRY domain-containing protein 1 [Caenorhabditis elegans]